MTESAPNKRENVYQSLLGDATKIGLIVGAKVKYQENIYYITRIRYSPENTHTFAYLGFELSEQQGGVATVVNILDSSLEVIKNNKKNIEKTETD